MKKLVKLSVIILISVFSLLLIGTSLLSDSNATCGSYSDSSLSPVNWIYHPDSAIAVTDVNITRSDCGLMVTGTIKNKYSDVTLLAVYLDLNLYSNKSQLLGVLNVDWERTLKPNQSVPFIARYDIPDTVSTLHHIYGQFYARECGVEIFKDMGCFGQRVNVSKIDRQTHLPVE